MRKYSQAVYDAVSRSDRHKIGVRLGCACIDANIPVQVVAKWFGITRQGVYYWFTGVTEVADEHHDRMRSVINVLFRAVQDSALPAKDLRTTLQVVKQYREKQNANT